MSERTAKALRKAFKAKENPEGFKRYKRALRNSDATARKESFALSKRIASSGKEIHVGSINVRD